MNVRKSTRKRTNIQVSTQPTPIKKKKTLVKELNAYFKTYKNGVNDFHWTLFREVNKIVKPAHVLYPGCHRHITASLVFNNVVYVDNYVKIAGCFTDQNMLEWIQTNKEYSENTKIEFKCKNFKNDFGESNESFDLLMSLSAGIVTKSCSKYIKKLGYCLVSDAHFDARMLYLDPTFKLTHVWNNLNEKFDDDKESLDGHFITTRGDPITKLQVDESMKKPKARRSFKLQKETLFYLFQRV